jgi:hypothetical protein
MPASSLKDGLKFFVWEVVGEEVGYIRCIAAQLSHEGYG